MRLVTSPAGQLLARWAATALAMGGFGCDPPKPARRQLPIVPAGTVEVEPVQRGVMPLEDFPQGFAIAQACHWLSLSTRASSWGHVKEQLAAGQTPELTGELAPLANILTGKASIGEISTALDTLEKDGLYDELIAAKVFQRTRGLGGDDLVDLLARVERHARVAIALRRGQAVTGAVYHMPWMSKAAPPRDHRECETEVVTGDFIKEARKAYDGGDAGSWDRDALLTFKVISGPGVRGVPAGKSGIELWRRGAPEPIGAGETVKLRRLDVLSGDMVLEHATLGRLKVKGDLGPWNSADFLSDEARQKLRATVKAAAQGDSEALDALDNVLPAARPFIEDEIAQRLDGAPGLRTQLTLFLE